MSQYGELLDTFYPFKEEFYTLIDNYFKHPILTKTKDVHNFSVYMVKTNCLLSTECRYIIAIVEKDTNTVKTQKKLAELFWISLQTRTMPDYHDIPSHGYQPKLEPTLLKQIDRIETTKEHSIYSCNDFPIRILLIHRKPNIISEYQPTGNLISAIETYQTTISFT